MSYSLVFYAVLSFLYPISFFDLLFGAVSGPFSFLVFSGFCVFGAWCFGRGTSTSAGIRGIYRRAGVGSASPAGVCVPLSALCFRELHTFTLIKGSESVWGEGYGTGGEKAEGDQMAVLTGRLGSDETSPADEGREQHTKRVVTQEDQLWGRTILRKGLHVYEFDT
jgi:hypothetical protein